MGEVFTEQLEDDPLKSVMQFMDANSQLVRAVVSSNSHPSVEILSLVERCRKNSIITLAPLVKSNFYVDQEDEELTTIAVGNVMDGAVNLYKASTDLWPDQPMNIIIDKDGVSDTVTALYASQGDQEINPVAAHLSNFYEDAVRDTFDKLMSADNVVDFGFRVSAAQERKRQIINFGVLASAAFLGTSLANILTRKSK